MAKFTFNGDQETTYPDLSSADGSTLVVKPGDVVELDTAPDANFGSKAKPTPTPEAPQSAPDAPVSPEA